MLGQPASWHTVCRPSRETRPRSCVYSGPIFALTLIQGGLRSIGVSALRASMRSIRRPSGWTTVTQSAYAPWPLNCPERDERHEIAGTRPQAGAITRARATTELTTPELQRHKRPRRIGRGEGAVAPRDPTR